MGLLPNQKCIGCDGKPNQNFEIAKSCCADGPPILNSAPDPYPDEYFYMGISARYMFEHGGSGAWANIVRGCLQCMYSHGAKPNPSHGFCYPTAWVRTSHLSALWGLGKAVEAAGVFNIVVNNPRPIGMR